MPEDNILRTKLEVDNTGNYRATITSEYVQPSEKAAASVSAALKKTESDYKTTANAGANSLKRLADAHSDIESAARGGAKIPRIFAEEYKTAFDVITRRAETARAGIARFSQVKFAGNSFEPVINAAFIAEKRINGVKEKIISLRSESSKPENAKFFKYYIEGIKDAEQELRKLETRAQGLTKANPANNGRSGGGRRGGITAGQATFLELADDFAPEGFNKAFNAVGRAALVAQNLKDAREESVLLSRVSVGTLGAFAGIAAAGAVIVARTGEMKTLAENRLKNEELISGAITKQVIGLQSAVSEYEKFKTSLTNAENFSKSLQSAVNTYDTKAVTQMRDRIDNENKSRISEINRLQSEVEAKERLLGFAKARPTNQNVLTELGLGREYTESQKRQDIGSAERSLEVSRKAQAEVQNALEKGKSNFQQLNDSLTDITNKQNQSFGKRFESFQKNQQDAAKFEKREAEKAKKTKETIQNAKIEFDSFLASTKSADNPFVKIFSDIDTAGERAEKRFASLGKEAVKFAAAADRAAATKLLNQTRFTTNLEALKLSQDARRIEQLPFSQTAEFTKSLTSIAQNVQHIAEAGDANRKLQEADYYARDFNPNNPKSFDESRRGGSISGAVTPVNDSFKRIEGVTRRIFAGFAVANDDFSEVGKQIFEAREEFKKLDVLKIGASGVLGQEIIADRKLSLLPNNDELLKRLESPFANVRDDARFGLNQRADALKIKRDAEAKKFDNALALDSYNDLRQKDFKEQTDLLRNSTGLDRDFAAKSAVEIGREIGVNNLDRDGLTNLRNAQKELAGILLDKERTAKIEADKEAQIKAARDAKIDTVITNITKLFGEKGLKVELSDAPVLELTVSQGLDVSGISGTNLPKSPNPGDTANTMGLKNYRWIDNRVEKVK